MPGYPKLNHQRFEQLFVKHPHSITVPASKKRTNPYSYEEREKVIIVHTPIEVGMLGAFLNDIQTRVDFKKKDLLFGAIGQGITEQHIVAMHLPPDSTQAIIYDPKYSHPEHFFSLDIPNKIKNFFHSVLRILKPYANNGHPIPLEHLGATGLITGTYQSLGTQSLFDGVSCGYHSGSTLKTLANLIENSQAPTTKMLLAATKDPVTSSAALIRANSPQWLDLSFSGFVKKAWQDTFLALIPDEERDNYHFGHYFMGWPSQKNGSKTAYFLTGKFISTPFLNLLSLLAEFPLNLLSESFSFLKNQLLSWAPTYGITQGIRSLLLATAIGIQAFFKGLSFLVRTLTSPLTSYQEAKKIHPALGIASAITSVILIGGILITLAFFAAPIFALITPTLGSVASPLLSALAMPVLELLGVIGASISTASAAMVTLIGCVLTAGIFSLVGRKVIYPPKSEAVEDIKQNLGSNVSQLLPPPHPGKKNAPEDEFTLLDPPPNPFEEQTNMPDTSYGDLTEERIEEIPSILKEFQIR